MNTLGIVAAKKDSIRAPNKNIADICGIPLMAYIIRALKASGGCDVIVLSTDSHEYGDIALKHGADDYYIRDESYNIYSDYIEFARIADEARNKAEHKVKEEFNEVVLCGGNVIFLRPSWIRAALTLTRDYIYNNMPIDIVGMESYHWNVNVCRVKRDAGIMTTANVFVFKHIGMLMEMDWPHELELARQIQGEIQNGRIDYPLEESVHDDLLENREQAANRMKGLELN